LDCPQFDVLCQGGLLDFPFDVFLTCLRFVLLDGFGIAAESLPFLESPGFGVLLQAVYDQPRVFPFFSSFAKSGAGVALINLFG